MFSTAVLAFCSIVAAFQNTSNWLNIVIKFSAAGLAAWASPHVAVYWGFAQ